MRLDVFLTENMGIKSRTAASVLIKDGKVSVGGKICSKPAFTVDDNAHVEIIGEMLKYVGRGGLKLEKAISEYKIDLNGLVCMDIGASTGGFTDCMLQYGAKKVYAVDVGSGQLDKKLLDNIRVVSLEKTDIRNVRSDSFEEIDFIGIDVSFISLKLVLPKAFELLSDYGKCIALIKPQFEAGRSCIGKNGIVKNEKDRLRVCKEIGDFCLSIGFEHDRIIPSPIKGGDGNVEYLICLSKSEKKL